MNQSVKEKKKKNKREPNCRIICKSNSRYRCPHDEILKINSALRMPKRWPNRFDTTQSSAEVLIVHRKWPGNTIREIIFLMAKCLRPSSCPIPMLWPIMCAIVPANKCGSYTLMSTLMPTDFGVHTVSGTATPDSPPTNVSPLQFVRISENRAELEKKKKQHREWKRKREREKNH